MRLYNKRIVYYVCIALRYVQKSDEAKNAVSPPPPYTLCNHKFLGGGAKMLPFYLVSYVDYN